MEHTPQQLQETLAKLGIAVQTTDHEPVFTVEESRHLRGQIAGAHTKNLFLRDNKRRFFLVTLEEDAVVDLKALRRLIGAKGGLSFGSPEALFEHLGVRPGAVSPFTAINDVTQAVTVVIDAALMQATTVNCHPLTNAQTTSIAPRDLIAFLRSTGHEPLTIALTS